MGNYSYVQSDFRGGQWDLDAQGRVTDERWKTALQVNLNAWSLEGGAWSRRPGFRYVCTTRRGVASSLLPFRFGRDQAYQALLSSGGETGNFVPDTENRLRFVVGLGLLMDETAAPGVTNITYTATVGYGESYGNAYGGTTEHTNVELTTVPGTWAVFDTVIFQPAATPGSYSTWGRQFEISSIIGDTINIVDPVTRQPPRITDFILRDPLDSIKRVLEYDTPYTEDDLFDVRLAQAIDNVLFLHADFFPYALLQNGATQFTFDLAEFHDGPYFDVNETNTTLTPSAATGSITVTASSTVGINDGDGFQSTDAGRLIRFQCGPPQWDAGTLYKKNGKVIGSDSNIYRVVKKNTGNDPVDDDGTNWEISPDTVFWTWLEITSVTSTTVVTATVRGDDLQVKSSGGFFSGSQPTLSATTAWRLGVYSETTGYPTCGTYWEGRLFLAGAISNRVDSTKSFGIPDETHTFFDFAPTYLDGTVADDSALSFTLNSKDVNPVLWMLGGDDGLSIGTASAEWLIKASQLDDPLTPFDEQGRPITTSGCADIEPGQAYGNAVFVQARTRKVLVNRNVPGGKVEPQNLSFYAGGLMAPGIANIAWAQEPALELAVLKTDDTLVGVSYKLSQVEESYAGWHPYEHGAARSFEAISSGPNFQGTGDALYAVTNSSAATSGAVDVRWVETIMPVTTNGDAQWAAWHTDASSTAYFIRKMILANGDSFDGIRVYGLDHLNGVTIHPWIGGLDLGNFVVSSGRIDIPYTATFTEAFLQGLSDGTDYGDGEWGMKLHWFDAAIVDEPQFPANTISVLGEASGRTTYNPRRGNTHWDRNAEEVFELNASANTVRVYSAINGELQRDAEQIEFFGNPLEYTLPPDAASTGDFSLWSDQWVLSASGRWLFGPAYTVEWPFWQIVDAQKLRPPKGVILNPGDLLPTLPGIGGVEPASGPTINHPDAFTLTMSGAVGDRDFGVTHVNRGPHALFDPANAVVSVYDLDDMARGFLTGEVLSTEYTTFLSLAFCRGQESATSSTFLMWSRGLIRGATSTGTSISLYKYTVNFDAIAETMDAFAATPVTLNITDIDAAWTDMDSRITFAADLSNGGWIGLAFRAAGAGSATRLFKLNSDFEVVWSVTPVYDVPIAAGFHPNARLTEGHWAYMRSGTVGDNDNKMEIFKLSDGTSTTIVGQASLLNGFAGATGRFFFDAEGPSFLFWGQFNDNGNFTYMGPFAEASSGVWSSRWNRLWIGNAFPQDQDHREINADYLFVPVNFGVSFTSRGQLLPPDHGDDTGARAGPGFGKLRRSHWWSAKFVDSFNVSIGTDFDHLFPIVFKEHGAATAVSTPDRFTGTLSDTLKDEYSFDGGLAWEITRQYPTTITAIGGYISSADK